MPIQLYLLVFFISLFFGSFYNVVALRTLSGENFAFPASHCTTCQHELRPHDLVPLLSWLFLRGKCRYCRTAISPLYPFGEFLTAFSYTLIVWTFGFTFETIIQLIFITIMMWATITDLKETIVPDRFVIIGLVAVGLLRVMSPEPLMPYVIASAVSFAFLLFVLIASGGRMGGADVKLYALIGLSIGLVGASVSLLYASWIGVLVFLPVTVMRKKSLEIPFVPFITAGVLLSYVITGQHLLGWVESLYSFLNI